MTSSRDFGATFDDEMKYRRDVVERGSISGKTMPPSPKPPTSDWVTDQLRHSGRVRRYHSWPVLHQQTVGEHCWQVYRICDAVFGRPSADVAAYIMNHDSAELVVGDPPFPVKMNNPKIKEGYDEAEREAERRIGFTLPVLSDSDRWRVKVCDLLEMMEFGMTEREMGNLLAAPIVLRTERTAVAIAREKLSADELDAVRTYVDAQWVRHEIVLRSSQPTAGYSRSTRHFHDLLK